MTIRAVVADDEPRARSRMRRLLAVHDDVLVVAEATHGEDVVQKVLAEQPDVLFLDIQMPGIDGLTAAQRLRDYLPESVRPLVVFTTAHAVHAVEAFGLESLDYLLKPVERDRLSDTLRRVRRAMWGRTPAVPSIAAAPVPTLTAHRGTALEPVAVAAMTVVQVEDGTAWAYTADERHRLTESLAELETRLPSPPFVRVSRSALVNTARVERVVPRESGTWEAVVEGGRTVSVSRRRAKHLREVLGVDA